MSNANPPPDPTRLLSAAAAEAVTTPLSGVASGAVTTPQPGAATGPTVATPRPLPAIPDVAIESELGRGGMGVVYRGRQTYVDRPVAVKVLSAVGGGEHASDYVQRFQREARILANLAHPHIVSCYQAGVTADRSPYLVMEFIDGPNLWQWLRANGPLSEAAALRVVADIARALGYASGQGIIHRDVKPENILLAKRADGAGADLPFTAKLVDLGLARPSRAGGTTAMQVTVPGMVMGTPATMAPEQFDDPENVDHRADIYGLGCVLYQALTGRPAFGGTSLVDIVTAKATGPAPDPRRLTPGVSAPAADLVRAMLAPRREDRPQTYQAIIDACERTAGATGARPTTPSRAPLTVVAIAVVAVVAAGAWWRSAQRSGDTPATSPTPAVPVTAPNAAAASTPSAAATPPPTAAATPPIAAAAPTTTEAEPQPATTATAAAPTARVASGDADFAIAQPLVGASFDTLLAGWEAGPGWGPEEDAGDGVSGVSGGAETRCTRQLAQPTLRLTGVLASGTAGAEGRFREAGVRLDLADGGTVTMKVQDLGGPTLHLALSAKAADGNVAATTQFLDLAGDPAKGWAFTLRVRGGTLSAEVAGQRTNPLPLHADARSVSLFVVKGAVAFRDLAVAYPNP